MVRAAAVLHRGGGPWIHRAVHRCVDIAVAYASKSSGRFFICCDVCGRFLYAQRIAVQSVVPGLRTVI